jgi:hypothetical protein
MVVRAECDERFGERMDSSDCHANGQLCCRPRWSASAAPYQMYTQESDFPAGVLSGAAFVLEYLTRRCLGRITEWHSESGGSAHRLKLRWLIEESRVIAGQIYQGL